MGWLRPLTLMPPIPLESTGKLEPMDENEAEPPYDIGEYDAVEAAGPGKESAEVDPANGPKDVEAGNDAEPMNEDGANGAEDPGNDPWKPPLSAE